MSEELKNSEEFKLCAIAETKPELYQAYCAYFNEFNIHILRNIGRYIGVERPTDKRKEVLINEAVKVLTGEIAPIKRSVRGAPVKEDYIDPSIIRKLDEIRTSYDKSENLSFVTNALGVKCGDGGLGACSNHFAGVLVEEPLGFGYIRDNLNGGGDEIFVPAKQIQKYGLRNGDFVVCHFEGEGSARAILSVISVCKTDNTEYENRKVFERFKVKYPTERLNLTSENKLVREINEKCPVGKGQRVLFCTDGKFDKYAFLTEFISDIENSNKGVKVFTLLLDGIMEDDSYIKGALKKSDIVTSDFSESSERKIMLAELTAERAKRYAELGSDSVVIINGVNSLVRAYNSCEGDGEKGVSSVFDYASLSSVKKYFSVGRNLDGGGSVSVIAFADVNNLECDNILLRELESCATNKIFAVKDHGGYSLNEEESFSKRKELFNN